MRVRLWHDAYKSDIEKIRNEARACGARQDVKLIRVSGPSRTEKVDLYMNFACSSNLSADPGLSSSLYIVGFGGNGNGPAFRFANLGLKYTMGTELTTDGSYGSLGGFPTKALDQAALDAHVLNVTNYTSGPIPGASLAYLIIAVSEAARFLLIEEAIFGVVKGGQCELINYQEMITSWDRRGLGVR